ncbi:MAG: efflux RND transporter permease subunit [Pyrinomonadaceae bacterium]|nr:efflux RND transporter permease subunit [Pyrinomonadaceae bacterium]
MWIVRLALRRPYTFIVMSMLILILGVLAIFRTPVDIFPVVDIPVIAIIWNYNGMEPKDMEGRIVSNSERAYTTTIGGIEHMESESYNGIAVIKIYFQPGADIPSAISLAAATSQAILRQLPPGTTPPLIVQYSAADVPVLQSVVYSDTLSEDQLNDFANQFIRTQLATVEGAELPLAYGGKQRNIMVDLDPQQMLAKNISASDVSSAFNAQNVILPAGTAKMGEQEYNVRLNSSPTEVDQLNDLPIKEVNGAMVYIRDIGHVRDGAAVQTNIVRRNGRRSALLTVLKSGAASTLDVVNRVRARMPSVLATLPPALKLDFLFDQSLFVRASINGVVREAVIAACLTGLMIMLFLGSWRATLIVVISIPLSILSSIIFLSLLGETLNIMTLGGLALAVGMLVDDATVEIENTHRNIEMGKPILKAILDGAQEVATPAFVSTLSICIVFVSVTFLEGAAKSLFTPLALAVVLAMLPSYILSRTLVPTLVRFLLPKEVELYRSRGAVDAPPAVTGESGSLDGKAGAKPRGDIVWRIGERFNNLFEKLHVRYRGALVWALGHRLIVCILFAVFCVASFSLFPFLGRDFFPLVDAGQFRLHVRAPAGTRIEETEQRFAQVEQVIRETVPPEELDIVLDNIGLPYSGLSLALSDSATIGSLDGEILVSLKQNHRPTQNYVEELRNKLKTRFPDMIFFFQPADIVTQVLNFGLPAPIDIQLVGNDPKNIDIAREIQTRVASVPGAIDAHLQQVVAVPDLFVNVDRTQAQQLGLAQRDVASDLLVSLSSSFQTAPNFWLNPQNGVSYGVQVMTPQYNINSMDTLQSTPISSNTGQTPQLLSNLATVQRTQSAGVVSHYDIQPTLDILANVQDRDLAAVGNDVDKILAEMKPKLPRGSSIDVRGQVETMQASFSGLSMGLVFAAILVYLLIVVNFQSWLDPFIITLALPGALSGIIWMLFVTQTTVSVPAMMGAIMTVGVATANSILLINFARDARLLGKNATEAALEAGYMRLRPVIMTATAMIFGMVPMALGLGDGGEQNAPLGRAVIGGLLVATFCTLFFVPVVYSILQRKEPTALSPEDAGLLQE